MKEAFDEFMRQEPELQEILTKRKNSLAAVMDIVDQPIHNSTVDRARRVPPSTVDRARRVPPTHYDSKSVTSDRVDLDSVSCTSNIQVTGVKAPSGGNIVQIVNNKLNKTGDSTRMNGKTHLDDRTHRIKIEDIVDPQLRRIMVLVYESTFEAEKVLSHSARSKGVFERTTNTEETVYALVMIDLLALSYAGLAWKTEKEKTAKISSYDATKGQTLRQFLPAYIRDRIRHRTNFIYNPNPGGSILAYQINAIEHQGMKAISLWYNFYLGIMMAVTGVQDRVFLRESLVNLSTIHHQEVESIR
jgi:hypothetical protein